MAPDGRVYPSLIFFQISADNGPVAPRNRMGLQLFCQRIMSAVIFAGNQHSRGILVDSVDDSGAQHSVDAGKLSPAVTEKPVHQCTGIMPR